MNELEGANCADLPGFVIDKYFGANGNRQRFRVETAKAICSHCVVLESCREYAMQMPQLPRRGVIAGVGVGEIRAARSWAAYELGQRAMVPNVARPTWLALSDAAQTVEQARLESDPDEPPVER